MKLNEKSKKELRKRMEEWLEKVPEGQRVVLDTDLLDDLIFFKGKNKEGLTIKVPIWTGKFLRKIDLSKLSFENVYFYVDCNFLDFEFLNEVMDAEPISRFSDLNDNQVKGYHHYIAPFVKEYKKNMPEHERQNFIDFSGTNINIDFKKIYGDKIECTNFSGVDLSNSNFDCLLETDCCNFSNTKINPKFDKEKPFYYSYTDFSSNDFSKISLDGDLFNIDEGDHKFGVCNFSNTGLNIKNLYPKTTEGKQALEYSIKYGYFEHCFVNGKEILSIPERKEIAQKKLDEYVDYQQKLFKSIESDINDQIVHMKR